MLNKRSIRILGGVLLVMVVWLLYGSGVGAPLVYDDLDFFSGRYVSIYGSDLLLNASRFWPFASFAHQHLLFGHGVAEMRIGNILLHALSVLTLQVLIARLLATTEVAGDYSPSIRHELVALCVAAVFAVHPVSVYAVAYLVQRSTLMATLFSLLMWICYLNAIQTGKPRWLGLSIICFYFAAFSKQHAVLAPMVSMALSILYWRLTEERIGWRLLVPVFFAYAVIAAGVVLPSTYLLGTIYEPLLDYLQEGADWHDRLFFLERVHWMSMLTQCGMFFKYLYLWLWPDQLAMSVDMREAFVTDLSDLGNWLRAVAFLGYGGASAALLLRGRRSDGSVTFVGLIGFGLFVPWGLFLVELMTVRMQEVFVLYRSYLWMGGLMIPLAVALDYWATRFRAKWVFLACIPMLVLTAYGATQRLQTFSSEKLLWDDAVRLFERGHEPHVTAERAYNNRGVAFAKEKNYSQALADYQTAIAFNPKFYVSYQSRGEVQMELRQYEEAIVSFKKVLSIRPAYTNARISIARALERMDRKAEALVELKRACDEGSRWGCYLYEKKINPSATFLFKANPD